MPNSCQTPLQVILQRDEKRAAKAEEESRIQEQHQEIKDSKEAQVEARLKYLLSQSDIFSHFGQAIKP